MVVTGGCGFIGRAVLADLRARGVPVVVVDLAPLPPPWSGDDGVRLIQADLRDPATLDSAVRPGTAAIVHLAAVTSVLGSVRAPAETYRLNVGVTQQLLELARVREVGRFVLASTNAVVGDVGESVITEELAPHPLTPYGATKAAAEMLALGYAGSYDLTACALRFTNVYGPGMDAKDSFVPRMMRAAITGTPIQIYGTGEQSRDLVYVGDVARAVGLALDADFTGRAIIGSGRSVSVLEMLELVRQVTGRPIPAEHVPAPTGEMPAVRVDLRRSADVLGYVPRVELADGLAEVWQDFRDHFAAGENGSA